MPPPPSWLGRSDAPPPFWLGQAYSAALLFVVDSRATASRDVGVGSEAVVRCYSLRIPVGVVVVAQNTYVDFNNCHKEYVMRLNVIREESPTSEFANLCCWCLWGVLRAFNINVEFLYDAHRSL